MVDIGQMSALIGGINGALEIIKTAKGLKDSAEVNTAVIQLQNDLIALQGTCFTLHELRSQALQERDALVEKVRKFEDWAAEAEKYELRDFGGHTFAYVLKEDVQTSEPEHYLCPSCYQERKKSILQFRFRTLLDQANFHCASCDHDIDLGHKNRR